MVVIAAAYIPVIHGSRIDVLPQHRPRGVRYIQHHQQRQTGVQHGKIPFWRYADLKAGIFHGVLGFVGAEPDNFPVPDFINPHPVCSLSRIQVTAVHPDIPDSAPGGTERQKIHLRAVHPDTVASCRVDILPVRDRSVGLPRIFYNPGLISLRRNRRIFIAVCAAFR